MEKKKKEVWVRAGVGVGGRRVAILAGVEKGMWGSWNVLECLEQSGIIEWIWNKKRQTEVLGWKNVHLGRLKKHSIHSDSFSRPRGFLRWHYRKYNPLPYSPSKDTLTSPALPFTLFFLCLLLTLQGKERSSIYICFPWCLSFYEVCQEWSSFMCLQIVRFEKMCSDCFFLTFIGNR